MTYRYQEQEYPIVIERKGNKHTYIQVLDDLSIQIRTHYFVRTCDIEKLILKNTKIIDRMLARVILKQESEKHFYYLGKKYDIIILPTIGRVSMIDDKIYTRDSFMLDRWYKEEMKQIFKQRLDILYHQFCEDIPYPNLKIRKMKTRWGVCNRSNCSITLNSMLLRYSILELDYVIIHELSHLVHFNHSKEFWKVVEKYCPDYKIRRAILRK